MNIRHLTGRSGISRIMFTSLIVLILSVLAISVTAQDDGGTLIVGLPSVETLDPALGTNDPEVLFNGQIYDRLIDVLPDGTLAPNLAQDWTISEDGLTYTFNLVEGVTFHDGSPFTAADVVFTFNRLVELESSAVGLLGEFTVEAIDDTTVQFVVPQINADFLYGIASRFASILKDGTTEPNVIAEGDAPYANFNGTGPFVLSDYSPGESAIFTANENYWIEGQPTLDAVEFLFIGDSQARVDALSSGVVDFIFKITSSELATLGGQDGIVITQQATNQHPLVRIRADEGALGEDPRILQAFRLTTNRQELLDVVQEGLGVVGNNNPLGPKYGDFYVDVSEDVYDPEAACALILEATGEERISSDFYVSLDFANYGDLGLALRDQWSQGCIDVEVIERDPGIYYGDGEWLEVDLGITGWGDRPVPSYFVEAFIEGAPFNETHFADEEVASLVAQANQTVDTATRRDLYTQIAEIFEERGPVIVPWFSSVVGAYSDNVEGLVMAPFPGSTDFRTVSVTTD
ncbi:MAG: ABC transporter substrate-binding protein [Aggregatilineales bacterium]